MVREFIPYEEALVLKKLGFDIPCLASYLNKDEFNIGGVYYRVEPSNPELCIAPLYQQAFRWFRDMNYETQIYSKNHTVWYFLIKKGTITACDNTYNTFEEAQLDCLRKLIEIYKIDIGYK